MFVRLKRPKKYVMPNGHSRRSAMRPYWQSKPRPKAQIVKSHYKLNETAGRDARYAARKSRSKR